MDIIKANYTIMEIKDMWARRELIVNQDYQRSPSVWPDSARTYFIDTILNNYPFPKVYLYQIFDSAQKKVVREIVDGQQRLSTILSFLDDGFVLSKRSVQFQGKCFSDLESESQQQFLTYNVEADIIFNAEKADLLGMFTRMNAYTAPLNPAEKRHAEFEGQFKWFILEAIAEIGPRLVELNVLTRKQAVRMRDAEFLTELAIVLDRGIVDKSEPSLRRIYRAYDKDFPDEQKFRDRFSEFMEVLEKDFAPLRKTFLTKSYVCHSLFCALMQKKYGIPGGDEIGVATDGVFFSDLKKTLYELEALVGAQEIGDVEGRYGEYVLACQSSTHRLKQRKIRTRWLIKALI